MKKTAFAVLLAAVCAILFTSCGMGNGLVFELFGETMREEETIGSPDHVIDLPQQSEGTDEIPIQPLPVETAPPVEYTTDPETGTTPMPGGESSLGLVMDGRLTDWNDSICVPMHFDCDNLDTFFGVSDDVGSFTLRMAADPQYVYFAIEVMDDNRISTTSGSYTLGDHFCIGIDLGGWCAQMGGMEKCLVYSFALASDNTMSMTVNYITDDAKNGASYQMSSLDPAAYRLGEVIGKTRTNDAGTGWIAEFAISYETLYRDAARKLESVGKTAPSLTGEENYQINLLICYYDEYAQNGISCGYGTPKEAGSLADDRGWHPDNAGVTAHLNPLEGRGEIVYASPTE